MKTNSVVLLLLLMTMSVWGQNQRDQEAVLQKCIDFPEFKKYSSTNGDGEYRRACILQKDIVFPLSLIQSEFGRKVGFLNEDNFEMYRPDCYFSFTEFTVTANSAKVAVEYHFNNNDLHAKGTVSVIMTLDKRELAWNIAETYIERR